MAINHGHIVLRKQKKSDQEPTERQFLSSFCDICFNDLNSMESEMPSCLNEKCLSACHLTCLADLFTEIGHYIPINGQCRLCQQTFLWGDLIRKRNGCSDSRILIDDNDESD